MLGLYENFPEQYHGIIRLHYRFSARRLQRLMLNALYNLNQGEEINSLFIPAVSDCKVNLDLGLAEGITFNFLNRETFDSTMEVLSKETMPVLDFLCIVRYYRMEVEQRRPLKFDYFLLRFIFYEGYADFQIFHEKGTGRLSIEEISTIIIERINRELSENGMPKMNMEYARTP